MSEGQLPPTPEQEQARLRISGEAIFKAGEMLVTLIGQANENPEGQAQGLIVGGDQAQTQYAICVIRQKKPLSEKQMAALRERAAGTIITPTGVGMPDIKIEE